jgi:hypothetical protein
MPPLPLCTDGSAYASLLTTHGSIGGNTYMTKGSVVLGRQVLMLLILLRSLRSHERACRRPFVLLRGEAVRLSADDEAVLQAEGEFRQHMITPIKLGVPPFDKLHAWNLSSSSYARILVVDADAMMLRPVEELFAAGAWAVRHGGAPLTMAHHGYDKAQEACHIPLDKRGVGGFYVMSPSRDEFASLVRETTRFKEEQTGVACYFDRRQRLETLPCPYFCTTHAADPPLDLPRAVDAELPRAVDAELPRAVDAELPRAVDAEFIVRSSPQASLPARVIEPSRGQTTLRTSSTCQAACTTRAVCARASVGSGRQAWHSATRRRCTWPNSARGCDLTRQHARCTSRARTQCYPPCHWHRSAQCCAVHTDGATLRCVCATGHTGALQGLRKAMARLLVFWAARGEAGSAAGQRDSPSE